jgi:hypothetical protein
VTDVPFGPWFDDLKWKSKLATNGDPRYQVDLGKDPVKAQRKMEELRKENFLGPNTRRAYLSMTVYNNALPMFCFVQLVFTISPTWTYI